MKKIVSCVISGGLALLALSGCAAAQASQVQPAEQSASTTTFSDGLLTYQVEQVEGTLVGHTLARLEGTLTSERGCLLVAGQLVVFPADGTSWDGTALTVNGNEFALGDTIVLGGGVVPDATLPENTPDQCEEMPAWYGWGAEAPA